MSALDSNAISAAAAVVSAIVAIVAAGISLYVHYFKPQPNLSLELLDGVAHSPLIDSETSKEIGESYWLHVKSTNTRRRISSASNPVLFVSEFTFFDKDGAVLGNWVVDVPLRSNFNWPSQAIGRPVTYAIYAVQRRWATDTKPEMIGFEIPAHFLPVAIQMRMGGTIGGRIRLKMEASSNEVDSPPLTVEISWDGAWPVDKSDLDNHLKFRVV